jgi:dolichol-phosphate mannosyltransferase
MLREEENVDPFMNRLLASLEKNANSWKIIAPIMKNDPTIDLVKPYPVIIVDRPLELGSAFAAGMKHALDLPAPIITMVSDLSNLPEEMNLLINTPGDIVIGARGPEIPRRLLSRVVNGMLKGPCTDYTNAYRLYDRRVVEAVLPKMRSRGFAFLPEFIFRALKAGYKVSEVNVSHPPRVGGYSKLHYRSNLHEYLRLVAWRYLS